MRGAAHDTSAFGSRSALRRFAMVPIVAVHAVVLALVAGDHMPRQTAVIAGPRLATFDLPAPAVQPDAAPPSARRDDPPETLVLPPIVQIAAPTEAILLAPLAPVLADAVPVATTACDLAGQMQTVLRADPAVRAALATLPRDARSVANAVMLWDGRWIEGTTPPARAALQTIKDVVLTAIANAPSGCRAETVAGPRLVALAGPPDTVLALGSGRWSWNDLVASSGGRWRMRPPTAAVTIAALAAATLPAPGT